jgi:hypothetical protein
MKFEEVEIIIEEIIEDYLDGIGSNCNEDGVIDFGNGVGYKNKNELIDDLISFLESNKE